MIHYLVAIYYRIIILINDLFNTSIYKKIKNEYQAIQLGKKHNYVSGSNVYFGKYLNEKVIIKGFDIFNLYKNEINILNILNQSNFVPGILKVSKKYFIEEYVDGQTFDEYLKENKYDAILMPHLFPAEMVTQMKAKGINLPPTIFVATDYVCTPFTEETNCDAYVIPSRHVRYDFLRRGIPEEKIKSLGIPVRKEFAKKVSKEEARKELGLEEDTFYLLVSAGSMGAGGIVKTIKLLYRWCKKQNKKLEKKRKKENENQRQTKLIIICGNNKVLYETLQKIVGDDDCVILTGFTKQMALYLKASDVCITKPGGLSSTEAAVANIPFIHAMAIPGCETRNLEFFESCGMSIGVKKTKGQLIRAVNRIQGKELCETMKLAQRKFVRPDSGMAICRLTEKMVRDRQNVNL